MPNLAIPSVRSCKGFLSSLLCDRMSPHCLIHVHFFCVPPGGPPCSPLLQALLPFPRFGHLFSGESLPCLRTYHFPPADTPCLSSPCFCRFGGLHVCDSRAGHKTLPLGVFTFYSPPFINLRRGFPPRPGPAGRLSKILLRPGPTSSPPPPFDHEGLQFLLICTCVGCFGVLKKRPSLSPVLVPPAYHSKRT